MDDISKSKRKNLKAGLTYNKDENRFVVTFDPDISKTEFLEQWSRFEKARREMYGKSHFTKRRQPNDIQLLLGVKFYRSFNITFKSIHELYRDKKVPFYEGDYKFDTEFELNKYYNRNIKKVQDT